MSWNFSSEIEEIGLFFRLLEKSHHICVLYAPDDTKPRKPSCIDFLPASFLYRIDIFFFVRFFKISVFGHGKISKNFSGKPNVQPLRKKYFLRKLSSNDSRFHKSLFSFQCFVLLNPLFFLIFYEI